MCLYKHGCTVCRQLDVERGRGRGVAKDEDSAWEVTSESEIEVHTHTQCVQVLLCVDNLIITRVPLLLYVCLYSSTPLPRVT